MNISFFLSVKIVEASATRVFLRHLEPAVVYEVTLIGRGHEKNSSEVTRQQMVVESGRPLNTCPGGINYVFLDIVTVLGLSLQN